MTLEELDKQRILKNIENRRMQKKRRRLRHRITALCSAIAICAVTTGAVYDASAKEVTLTEINEFNGLNETTTIKTRVKNVDELLESCGVEVSHTDKINIPVDSELNDKEEIVIKRGKEVTIKTNETETTAVITKADVTDALVEAGIMTGENDEVVTDGDSIEVISINQSEDVSNEAIAHGTEYVDDPELYVGETSVKQEGTDGNKKTVYSVTYKNGEEASREVISEDITEPVNEIIAKGTKVRQTVVTPPSPSGTNTSGDTGNTINGRKYSKKITMTATAYSTSPSENGGYTVSAMGNPLGYGVVAVDPSVVPLGSTVYVESTDGSWTYGVASAEDTGGAIKGNKIDLCYEGSVSEVNMFGRRSCNVYILED